MCMNLMLIVSVLLLCMERLAEAELSERKRRAGAAALCILLLGASVFQIRTVRRENVEMYQRNEAVEELKAYCTAHPENFYFNDVVSMAMGSWNVDFWRSEPFGMNYISLGDWISFSPVWEEKLLQQGITDVPEALYGWDHIYLICSFDRGLELLTELYEDVAVTEVDKVAGFGIYQLRR